MKAGKIIELLEMKNARAAVAKWLKRSENYWNDTGAPLPVGETRVVEITLELPEYVDAGHYEWDSWITAMPAAFKNPDLILSVAIFSLLFNPLLDSNIGSKLIALCFGTLCSNLWTTNLLILSRAPKNARTSRFLVRLTL